MKFLSKYSTGAMKELIENQSQTEGLLLKLLSHLTMLDATVLGLLAALCDRPQSSRCILVLTTLGVLLLFLALAGGVAYMFRYYSLQITIYNNRYQELTREDPDYEESSEDIPMKYIVSALFCPIGSVAGLLFLLLSFLLFLWS